MWSSCYDIFSSNYAKNVHDHPLRCPIKYLLNILAPSKNLTPSYHSYFRHWRWQILPKGVSGPAMNAFSTEVCHVTFPRKDIWDIQQMSFPENYTWYVCPRRPVACAGDNRDAYDQVKHEYLRYYAAWCLRICWSGRNRRAQNSIKVLLFLVGETPSCGTGLSLS